MSPKTSGLKVPKKLAEETLALAKSLRFLNKSLKVRRAGNSVFIPLTSDAAASRVEEIVRKVSGAEVGVYTFDENVKKTGPWQRGLKDLLPPHLLAALPRSVDFVGDIAVLELSPELEGHKRLIGEKLLATHKRVKTVLVKASSVDGEYRLRQFEVAAGEKKTTTLHWEHGLQFFVDLAKAYFSPRLSYEHKRVASLVQEGETVVDMFSGVGSFAVHIAKNHENVKVYAIDVNPDAVKLLERNILANRVADKVVAILGNAREVVAQRFEGVADRIVMNLPENALKFVDVACEALKPQGGVIHYYEFAEAPNPTEKAKLRLIEAVEESNRRVEKLLKTRLVRAIAPFAWQVVVDAYVK